MRKAEVFINNILSGYLIEHDNKQGFCFEYLDNYNGPSVSLTMPTDKSKYEFDTFPAFFDGLLPEGPQLDGLLRQVKLDKYDYFGQLVTVGNDTVGAVTIKELLE